MSIMPTSTVVIPDVNTVLIPTITSQVASPSSFPDIYVQFNNIEIFNPINSTSPAPSCLTPFPLSYPCTAPITDRASSLTLCARETACFSVVCDSTSNSCTLYPNIISFRDVQISNQSAHLKVGSNFQLNGTYPITVPSTPTTYTQFPTQLLPKRTSAPGASTPDNSNEVKQRNILIIVLSVLSVLCVIGLAFVRREWWQKKGDGRKRIADIVKEREEAEIREREARERETREREQVAVNKV
ncbi:hypothetical protein BC829DRAFT_435677 [Chytridium lagenaria]|nr:hypothetical protein BC829DRAFT_435677 [Chytridium lagenaria]